MERWWNVRAEIKLYYIHNVMSKKYSCTLANMSSVKIFLLSNYLAIFLLSHIWLSYHVPETSLSVALLVTGHSRSFIYFIQYCTYLLLTIYFMKLSIKEVICCCGWKFIERLMLVCNAFRSSFSLFLSHHVVLFAIYK